jgi:hypothetical protein
MSFHVWQCGFPAGRRSWDVGLVAVSERKSYRTDVSDEQRALVEPLIVPKAG